MTPPPARDPDADAFDRAFPGEAEWLHLPPPPIDAGFTARTWQRIRADRGADAGSPADEPLRRLLPAHQVPEPSPGFVAATLAAIQRDRAEVWRSLLLRYQTPTPSADFVQRTLRALQTAARPGPRRRTLWLAAGLAAAAAVVLALVWPRPLPVRSLQEAALERVPPASAAAFSPTPMAGLLLARPAAAELALADLPIDGLMLVRRQAR